jgi:mannose-6-phosphate isomerase-like protein (cupin superfamily)
MPAYSIKNLMEIDDLATEDPGREIRFSRKYIDSSEIGATYQRYAPGYTSTDGHHHDSQEEVYVIIEGSGAIRLDDERVELKQWDVVRVSPPVVRGFDAGPDGLTMIAVGGSKPEGGDGHVVEGRWPAD